jgi:hypothetical protein
VSSPTNAKISRSVTVAGKPIQEQFGQEVIDAFARFARSDLKTPDGLEADEFSHVSDARLRRHLAEVFYGVRWIYKLGLALLTTDAERAAHIRAQIVDYASVSECLLAYCLAHAIRNGHVVGTGYQFHDPDVRNRPITWNATNPAPTLRRQNFWWMIRIAKEFGIIHPTLKADLEVLRKGRNTVHLQQRSAVGHTAFLNQSKRAFDTAMRTIRQTKSWKSSHP